ncbi:MAG: hypothetical protein IT175_11005 [Acidobacteria bacterium]|nr:hypothetical protein [Acidobacteriota bacterium]
MQVPLDSIVVLSWGRETAVYLPWSKFLERWDDLCYPSSDDVLVAQLDIVWLLAFWHIERCEFAEAAS